MKPLFDESLPPRAAVAVQARFPGSVQVKSVGPNAADDLVLYRFAAANRFTIVARDKDVERLSMAHGSPPKVILVDVGNARIVEGGALIVAWADEIPEFEASATEDLLRLEPSTVVQVVL